MSPFIDDGYTLESKIEVTGFDPFTVKHRPLVGAELSWLAVDESGRGPDLLARKITDWSLTEKPTAATMRKLHRHVYETLLSKVVGSHVGEAALKN